MINYLPNGTHGGGGGGDYHQRFHRWKDEIYSPLVSQDCPLPPRGYMSRHVRYRYLVILVYAEKNEMFVQIQFVCNIVPRDFLSRRFIMQYTRELENYFRKKILAKKVLVTRV